MNNASSFGRQSAAYAKGRPGYPPALYDWIVVNSPSTGHVWDVGCGSGQATIALSERFDHVHATDISDAQINAATPHPNINYAVAGAQDSGLPGGWADAITVATALHWFADKAFWAEVTRVGKPGALFCAWTYQLPTAPKAVMDEFLRPVLDLIDPYWAKGNRICMAGYSADNLNCPLPMIDTPALNAGSDWRAEQLTDFVYSWSAHLRAREDGHSAALSRLSDQFLAQYGGHNNIPIPISMPLSLLAARIG